MSWRAVARAYGAFVIFSLFMWFFMGMPLWAPFTGAQWPNPGAGEDELRFMALLAFHLGGGIALFASFQS